jgi:predicted dinucleotide-binding enzyme
MDSTKIGIIGRGNVGGALCRALKRAGNEVKATGRDRTAIHDAVKWGDVIVLALPYGALGELVKDVGELMNGKIVIDVTNALTPKMELAVGFTTSGAEELQKQLPNARVVKAFNTIFAQHMDTGRLVDRALTAFVASDDAEAKKLVLELARSIGFDALDSGPLKNARLLEPLGFFNIQLGYVLGHGPQIGFKLLQA